MYMFWLLCPVAAVVCRFVYTIPVYNQVEGGGASWAVLPLPVTTQVVLLLHTTVTKAMATMFKPIPEVVVSLLKTLSMQQQSYNSVSNTTHATATVTTVFQTQHMQQQQLQQYFKHNTCNSNSYNSVSNTTHATATVTTVFQTQPMQQQQLQQCFKHNPCQNSNWDSVSNTTHSLNLQHPQLWKRFKHNPCKTTVRTVFQTLLFPYTFKSNS